MVVVVVLVVVVVVLDLIAFQKKMSKIEEVGENVEEKELLVS